MRLLAILFSVALLPASYAASQTYGTPNGGCERAAGNPVNDADAYFDGSHFGGQDWGCDLTPAGGDDFVGLCTIDGDDQGAQVMFTVTHEGDTVAIIADGDVDPLILLRCP